MKAAQAKQYGIETIEVIDNITASSPQKGQIVVDVHAASINPFDVKLLLGIYKGIPITFPYTPGGDFSGVVTELGEGVTEYAIGDEIFGSAITLNGGSGAYAQIATVNVANSAQKPKKVDFIHAASLPLVGSSAIQALVDHIKLQNGQKILIHGGAGGIGSIAIQLAKHIGAFVATTVSGDDMEFVKNLGADQIINYKADNFAEQVHDFDAVYDTVGGETANKSFQILKKGGILVSMQPIENQEEQEKQYEVTAFSQQTKTNKEHLQSLSELVDQEVIKPQVDKVFTLDQTKAAFEFLENESPKGKVVIKIR